MMSEPFYDDRISIPSASGTLMENSGGWVDGEVLTPLGIVSVYAQTNCTYLRFVVNGQLHLRTFSKQYSNRFIVTLADRFTKEMVDNE